ncbi:MAG: hypothetical protein AB1430_07570 [Pseudomonadota bacterium]
MIAPASGVPPQGVASAAGRVPRADATRGAGPRFEARLAQQAGDTLRDGTAVPPAAEQAAALQALLALPLRWPPAGPAPSQAAAPATATTPAAAASLTPHDLAATLASAWVQEPASVPAPGLAPDRQWTFGLQDPMTPLALLRISGDARQGWHLQLGAAPGVAPRELALRAEQLRSRLQARGLQVQALAVDDAEEDAR